MGELFNIVQKVQLEKEIQQLKDKLKDYEECIVNQKKQIAELQWELAGKEVRDK